MSPSRRVLIIEDCAEDRQMIRRFLQQDPECSNIVQEAPSGPAGIAACQDARPDVIILDHLLVGMDGLGTLRALRQVVGVDAPVVFLTGVGGRLLAHHALEAGAEDYLDKASLSAALLNQALSNAIVKRRLRRELELASLRTARLQEMTAALSGARTVEEVLNVIVTKALSVLDAQAGVVGLLDEARHNLLLWTAPGYAEEQVAP